MTPRRPGDLIPLAPMPADEALSLRVHLRKGHPPAYIATDASEWWWLAPIIIESPAPLPTRRFDHAARVWPTVSTATVRWGGTDLMLGDEILAIHEPTYRGMREVLDLYTRGVRLTVDEAAAHAGVVARAAAPTRQATAAGGTVMVLPLVGFMTYRPSFLSMLFGGTSVAEFTVAVRRAAFDTSVSTLVIPTDSPGGSVDGAEEAAAAIAEATRRKRVIAVADVLAASAAYWVISGASEIIASPSAKLGSIGTLSVHDCIAKALNQAGIVRTFVASSRFKTEGSETEPLSAEARAEIQRKVNAFDAMMTARIAAGRRVTAERVRSTFREGRVLLAQDAVARGMADRLGTLADVLGALVSGTASPSRGVSAAAAPDDADLDARRRRLRLAEAAHRAPAIHGITDANADLDRRRRRLRLAALVRR